MSRLRRLASRPLACALLAGLCSLGVYVATMAPGLTWAHDGSDGADLATAAGVLGIAHPPGYPSYALLAHPFTWLPVGSVATRTNLFSACCAAAAVAVLAWGLAQRGGHWVSVVSGAGVVAVCPMLWSQAVVTEVHALNALFASLLLVAAQRAGRTAGDESGDCDRKVPPDKSESIAARNAFHDKATPKAGSGIAHLHCIRSAVQVSGVLRPRDDSSPIVSQDGWKRVLLCVGIGLLWGLSMGNSPTAFFFLPLVLLSLHRRHGWGWGALGAVVGLSVYLYLPLRATASAALNWGDPRTVGRLWWMVSGALYRGYLFAIPRAAIGARILAWLGLLSGQFFGIGLVLVFLGAMGLWSSDRGFLAASGAVVLLCSILAIGYDTTDSYLYVLPAVVCLGLWFAVGLNRFLESIRLRYLVLNRAVCLFALLVPAVVMGVRWPEMNLRHDREAERFLEGILAQAPPRALFLSQHDAHTFSLRYAQIVRGERPDLVVVDLDLLGQDWYTRQLSAQLPRAQIERLVSVQDPAQVARELGRDVCQGVTLETWSCWTGAAE